MSQGNQIYDVAVIGGGAAGMTAAIRAAESSVSVIVIEKNESCGRKILVTGNGRCNFTNEVQGRFCYRGADPAFVESALQIFGRDDTLQWFRSIGIEPYSRRGYYYPASGQASSVRAVMIRRMMDLGVTIMTGTQVRGIRLIGDIIEIPTQNLADPGHARKEMVRARAVVAACGGMASPQSGTTGDGYYWCQKLGIPVIPQVPALVQLNSDDCDLRKIAGVRAQAAVHLIVDGEELCCDTGEVQFTKDALSGIPVFQVSRYAAYALEDQRECELVISFLPWLSEEDRGSRIRRRIQSACAGENIADLLAGFVPDKISGILAGRCGISDVVPEGGMSDADIEHIVLEIAEMHFHLTGTHPYRDAQTTAGGLDTHSFDPATMGALEIPGLFAAGEIMDVDGICGGYNLQWAWTSGTIAGRNAAEYSIHSARSKS